MAYSRPLQEQDDLKNVVAIFLRQLIEEHPELKEGIEKNKDALIDNMCRVLRERKPDLSTKDLADKEWVKELTIALMSVIILDRILGNDKSLLEKLQKLFDPKNKDQLKDPKNLKKLFTPEEFKKIHEDIQKYCDTLLKDLEKYGLVKPTPNKKSTDEMAKGFDPYENLLGLANSLVTGSIATVVQSFMGNGLGFSDWNPNGGLANIDRINSTNDTQQADPLALNASTMGNFLQFIGDAFVESFQKELRSENLAASNIPKYTHP